MHVLIADDDSIMRFIVRQTLQQQGHVILEAADGAEAWEIVQREPVTLVIADWLMPELDGPTLIARIRQAGFDRYVYCVLLTSRDRQEDRLGGLEAGADDYMTKPVDVRELRARLTIASRIIALESELRSANDQLRYQATHDQLTDLHNRPAITEYASSEIARSRRSGQPLSLAVIDVDHFKQINDSYGHLTGDQALRHIAQCLRKVVRPYDWLGRWGGEEFLLVLPNTSLDAALEVAERARRTIAEDVFQLPGGGGQPLSASIGVASTSQQRLDDIDTLFQQADDALYRAKAAGRNCVRS